MFLKSKFRDGIGRKLILSFSIILILTILSVLVATLSIKRIDASKNELTDSSIPALVVANQLSRIALEVVQDSLQMDAVESVEELTIRYNSANLHIEELRVLLKLLKQYSISEPISIHVKELLDAFEANVDRRTYLISNLIKLRDKNDRDIASMLNAIEVLLDLTSVLKIEVDVAMLDQLSVVKSTADNFSRSKESFSDNINRLIEVDIYRVEAINQLIASLNEIRKDLQNIMSANNREIILSIQQEFDHILRGITRTIVKISKGNLRDEFGPHVSTLIQYGQDTNDIFQGRIKILELSEELAEISNENLSLTQNINDDVLLISTEVNNYTKKSASTLDETVALSRNILIIIAIIAIAISLLIVWKVVYKNIISKLMKLSWVTKKLSNHELDIEIDLSGHNEFSDIAKALEALRENSIKREELNRKLSEKSKQLERSNEDLTQFAYVASHDLQEPLRMVGSYVQLLDQRYKDKLDDEADKFINFAVEGCLRMQAMIKDLLIFSRVDSGDEAMQPICLDQMLNEVVSDLDVRIYESKATIKWDELSEVYAVPTQVRAVLSNLINNAMKYCSGHAPMIEINTKVLDGNVQIAVKDNGIGINDKYQEKIFVIFKRLHTRGEFSGTGIGLSICKKIIERHGGKIWLESKLGEGSTFYFTLPAVPQSHQTKLLAASAA